MSIIKKIKTTITEEIGQLIRYRTELVIIDESEYSELQDKAAAWSRGHNLDKDFTAVLDLRECEIKVLRQQIAILEDEIESITNDATEDEGKVRDLNKELAFTKERLEKAVDYQGKLLSDSVGYADKCEDLKQTIREMEDRAQELRGELDSWHSLGSGYGLNLDVSDVEEKLELLEEWEDLISKGWSPSEIEEKLEAADDWVELGDDTGMEPCEISQELDRLEEVDADLRDANNRLGSAKSKAYEIGLIWQALETALDC